MGRRMYRLFLTLLAAGLLSVLVACSKSAGTSGAQASGAASPVAQSLPCGWWNAIGDTPTDAELQRAAGRYAVVVLNAWETAALRRLRALEPGLTVLVYKDFASTRNYAGAVVGGADARYLPTGVGYVQAQQHPEWFAADTRDRRIEWRGYPQHWQMAVWNREYQRAWVAAVTREVVREGWDGVLADNDFAHLTYYSSAILRGTGSASETDARLRAGFDALVGAAGRALQAQGKLLVPNISEARLFLGRWTAHTRFGGGLDEHFAYFGGSGDYLTDYGATGWADQTAQLSNPGRLSLLITHAPASNLRAQRYSYFSAAVRAQGRVCWSVSTVGDYSQPEWSRYQAPALGRPLAPGVRSSTGTWTRTFAHAWVAVNPTAVGVTVKPPVGFGRSALWVPAADARVLRR